MASGSPGTPGSPVGLLQDRVLVQTTASDSAAILRLADRDGSGLVLTGEDALLAARAVRERGPDRPLLVDRRRYAGNSRANGTATFSPGWIADQRRIGVARVLTDSGYIGAGDEQALHSVLGQAAQAGDDVTAVLPLHMQWLRGDVKTLISEVGDYGVPVALVLEHEKDPLGTRVAVEGLVELLRSAPSVGLLCCDTSALGAVAFGAQWAAVGARSNLRHLYPARKGGIPHIPSLSALVDPVLSIVTVEKIATAWAYTSDNPVWTCRCLVCSGRSLDWLITASEIEAGAHTFELLLDRRDDLVGSAPGPTREQSWRAQCENAIFRYEDLGLVGLGWDSPGFLRAWKNVAV